MKRGFPLLVLLFFGTMSVHSMEWTAVDADFAFSWQQNAALGDEPADKMASLLMFNPGVSFLFDFDGVDQGFYMKTGLWFSLGVEEVWDVGGAFVARPTDKAQLNAMTVLGMMIDVPFGRTFPVGRWSLSVQIGPAFYLRFPLWENDGATLDTTDYWNAYYAKGEFLHVGAAVLTGFPFSDTASFHFGLRGFYPISNAWTNAPWDHGLMAGATALLRFELDRTASSDQ